MHLAVEFLPLFLLLLVAIIQAFSATELRIQARKPLGLPLARLC